MSVNRRRRRPLNRPSQHVWLTTYGDLVTLVLAFFVMMFTFSSLDIERFRAIMSAFQGAVGIMDAGTTLVEGPAVLGGDSSYPEMLRRTPLETEMVESLLERLNTLQRMDGLDMAFTTEVAERGLTLRFVDGVLFDVGSADLRPEAEVILRQVFSVLQDWPYQIRVEGHTDDWPISTARYPSNWELSTARAARVVRFVVSEGNIPPDRLSAVGYGEYRPRDTNETAQGRAQNRRVEIVLLHSALSGWEPSATIVP